MFVTLPKDRGVSITLIGAISDKRGLIHAETMVGSNNQDTFKRFIAGLKAKCGDRRCVIIMENLSVHNARIVNEEFDRFFEKRLLPPYSCALNPIEKVWNLVKAQWRKTVHLYCMQQDTTEERLAAAKMRIR